MCPDKTEAIFMHRNLITNTERKVCLKCAIELVEIWKKSDGYNLKRGGQDMPFGKTMQDVKKTGGKYPVFTGQLTTTEREKIGKISLWENIGKKDNSPIYSGEITFILSGDIKENEKVRVALWNFEKKENV